MLFDRRSKDLALSRQLSAWPDSPDDHGIAAQVQHAHETSPTHRALWGRRTSVSRRLHELGFGARKSTLKSTFDTPHRSRYRVSPGKERHVARNAPPNCRPRILTS